MAAFSVAKTPKRISGNPGVYIFFARRKPLYVGKALNLKKRVSSYFQRRSDLGARIQMMLAEATRLETIEVDSEVEALIKEAELIKAWRPKYNILMRDDKSYFYVGVTRESYPKIFITHEPTKNLKTSNHQGKTEYIGPFTGGGALHITLKLLRRIFPYCTCKTLHQRPCLNSEIGRCPGYCCLIEVKAKQSRANRNRALYRKNIKNIVAILSGKRTRLTRELKRRLAEAAKSERYEDAMQLRDQLFGLEDIFRHRATLHETIRKEEDMGKNHWLGLEQKLRILLGRTSSIEKIEGYDISNISGAEATGSLVAFERGTPDKAHYRKFRIRTVSGISDVDMHKEVLARRLTHSEWTYPDILVIDGGKPQLNAALNVVREFRKRHAVLQNMLVTALAKREEILFLEGGRSIPLSKEDPAILHLFQRIRDESHRFAQSYHHLLRKRNYATGR